MTGRDIIACAECDLLQLGAPLTPGSSLRCRRCRAELRRGRSNGPESALAFTIAAVALLVISNVFPIVGLAVNGNLVQTTLAGAVRVLYNGETWPLSVLVGLTTILMPVLQTVAMLWLLLPLKLGRVPWRAAFGFRLFQLARPWGMTEVLILGLLVALVKLAHIATVVPGTALWSFMVLMLLLAAASAAFDPREVWARITAASKAGRAWESPPIRFRRTAMTASSYGLALCEECGLLIRPPARSGGKWVCPRCRSPLHLRKPASLSRTWAYLVAAIVLYVPANILPVMDTSSLFGAQKDTIMSGVVYLWVSGSWPLAILVFVASIVVPMLKILGLVYLTISTQLHSQWLPEQRTRIYRAIELVGRWSMLDIYVITMLVALVQFQALATIKAGPASIAFGAVVVLTLLAAMSFDPRLIWDEAEMNHVRVK
ncbi:Intermembrane transport protein PqiA [Paraburkholderia domus]|uniref:Intermembrane transport protein PqiA n=1 Tax=Paraburkholderia domus TaxID=2793075 RepID=A0A9N8QUD8_9BURK|nr:paraquat-inducible protein A [Paraburkholderia domus]MBK5049276.1 paraquat-inducible protein A [Burkholderia sp. R-70006]MBK5060245.1 paraquat-inducible protein A [Burkholderia sp. R-70199]MBK5085123.1 paraquat-inducible protein A [Burkholderia sp. R-69927]MBK5118509.1 paraquat-inducible protein A [Burkholderia sp. R-69980]MBK5164347.1 paraquat-inducible protein A [Burkholderia sp. R-70211]MBK5179616.1 paraquat-inducible protein A [Burkholderia sp. R-69749]